MGETLCVVCRRRPTSAGRVCDPDRDRITAMLGDLLRRMGALHHSLMPSPGPAADRVSTNRTGAPLPARLDVLSLIGPGTESVTPVLHPLIRHWSTTRTVEVTAIVAGKLTVAERQIVEWHQETARHPDGLPILVTEDGRQDDDQIGSLPPAEWLDAWVRAWRSHFGHAVPVRTRTGGPVHPPRPGRWDGRRQAAINTVLGLETHSTARSDDPLDDEWEIRFGEPRRDEASAYNVRYLLTWLDAACDDDVGIAAFAGELRTLNAELVRVLGETPDQQWLGRCPAVITDRWEPTEPGGPDVELRRPVSRPCGAGLWQDPHASQVRCPRCQSTWGPRPVELLYLAAEIRRTWPVDQRRRYTLDEIDELPVLRCPNCVNELVIGWRDVTATTDDTRWWRPIRVTCPLGCPEAERLI